MFFKALFGLSQNATKMLYAAGGAIAGAIALRTSQKYSVNVVNNEKKQEEKSVKSSTGL
jgi:hypothetical protein